METKVGCDSSYKGVAPKNFSSKSGSAFHQAGTPAAGAAGHTPHKVARPDKHRKPSNTKFLDTITPPPSAIPTSAGERNPTPRSTAHDRDGNTLSEERKPAENNAARLHARSLSTRSSVVGSVRDNARHPKAQQEPWVGSISRLRDPSEPQETPANDASIT